MRKMLATKLPQSRIRRGETRLDDAPSRRWQGEKMRLDGFLKRKKRGNGQAGRTRTRKERVRKAEGEGNDDQTGKWDL